MKTVDWVRTRIEHMEIRSRMFASTRESFMMQVWVLLEVAGVDVKLVRRRLLTSELTGEGNAFVSAAEPIDDAFVSGVASGALALLDGLESEQSTDADRDDALEACVLQLDNVCKWLAAHDHKSAADLLHENRNEFLLAPRLHPSDADG